MEKLTLQETEDGRLEYSKAPTVELAAPYDLPWQDAIFGGLTALVVSELITGVTSALPGSGPLPSGPFLSAVTKVGGAWAINRWGRGMLGAEGARISSAFLLFDAATDVVPIDSVIKDLLGRISLGSGHSPGLSEPPTHMTSAGQAPRSIEDYINSVR